MYGDALLIDDNTLCLVTIHLNKINALIPRRSIQIVFIALCGKRMNELPARCEDTYVELLSTSKEDVEGAIASHRNDRSILAFSSSDAIDSVGLLLL